MTKLAPDIFRQRILIEGYYSIEVDEQVIRDFFETVTNDLNLTMYGEPIIFSPAGMGKEENQGYDAFVPLVDSGISLYIWTKQKFLSSVIYTCKGFDEKQAIGTTKDFFKVSKFEFRAF
jgi:S-adenosylmethionine decarboxylase